MSPPPPPPPPHNFVTSFLWIQEYSVQSVFLSASVKLFHTCWHISFIMLSCICRNIDCAKLMSQVNSMNVHPSFFYSFYFYKNYTKNILSVYNMKRKVAKHFLGKFHLLRKEPYKTVVLFGTWICKLKTSFQQNKVIMCNLLYLKMWKVLQKNNCCSL